jgi:hypothetical protein
VPYYYLDIPLSRHSTATVNEGGTTMTAAGETTGVTPDILSQIASGFMAAKQLFIANEVGLFEHVPGDRVARAGIPVQGPRGAGGPSASSIVPFRKYTPGLGIIRYAIGAGG